MLTVSLCVLWAISCISAIIASIFPHRQLTSFRVLVVQQSINLDGVSRKVYTCGAMMQNQLTWFFRTSTRLNKVSTRVCSCLIDPTSGFRIACVVEDLKPEISEWIFSGMPVEIHLLTALDLASHSGSLAQSSGVTVAARHDVQPLLCMDLHSRIQKIDVPAPILYSP